VGFVRIIGNTIPAQRDLAGPQSPLVTGLTKDDFRITEDKQRRAIFSFEGPQAHTINALAGDDNPGEQAPRTIFVLDLLNFAGAGTTCLATSQIHKTSISRQNSESASAITLFPPSPKLLVDKRYPDGILS
jgi:hypothetical protein